MPSPLVGAALDVGSDVDTGVDTSNDETIATAESPNNNTEFEYDTTHTLLEGSFA
jgi:hypothetical protein